MANIQAGELDEQVALYSSTSTADSLGQPIKSYTLVETVWAIVREGHGTEKVSGREQAESEPLTVIIRHGTGVETDWKLVWNSNAYRITSTRRIGRDHWIELKAERIGDSESGN